ncbi:MAG TPA: polysaccharide deacetylase family protein [Blastocatellia bacterium]|nr:polysaccharide deacetylase family protein [Blastocatellia bacterium]
MKEEFVQLRAALDQFTAGQRTTRFFFRDDDVDEDEPSLRRLLEVFGRCGVPVNLAVIPGRLTDAAVALLQGSSLIQQDLIELNQHGWMHVNHETEGRKCEFGPGRSYDEQLSDIARGRRVLEDAFGAHFSPVFVPPWNRCTTETFRALERVGFQALSRLRGGEELTGYNFRELSVTLDLHRWKGGVTMKSPAEIVNEVVSQMRELQTVGVMLHHKVMDEEAFSFLALLVDELRSHACVRFHTFQSLLRAG